MFNSKIILTVCFKIFDLDRDNYLSSEEVQRMKQTLLFIASDNKRNTSNIFQSAQKVNLFMENITEVTGKTDLFISNTKTLECLEEKLDESGGLTLEDFLVWSVQCNSMIAPLLEVLFQVCHVSLGLRPYCRHEENEIGKIEVTLF